MSTLIKPSISTLIAAFTACLLLASCGTQGSARVPTGVDLSGHWHLNEKDSDSVEALLNSLKNVLDPPPRRTMVPPGTDQSGRIFSQRDEFVGPPRTKELTALLKRPTAFSLTQSDRSLTMKSIDGTTEYVFGETSVVSLPDGVGDQYCGWAGSQFVVGIRAVDGRKIEHLVGLSTDRAHLQVTTKVSGGGLPTVSLRRSYDRDEPGSRG